MKYLVISLLFLTACSGNIPERTCVKESTPVTKIHVCNYRGPCAVELAGGVVVFANTGTRIGDTVCLKYGMK